MANIETYEKIYVDRLTEDSVSILTKTFAEINGVETLIGNHRRGFTNSYEGRTEISEYLGEPYLSAVMSVWGDTPSVSKIGE